MTLLGATVVISGDDEFLRARTRDEAIAAFRAEISTVAVARFAGETLSPADVAQGLTPDLFGDTPALVVEDAQKVSKQTLDALVAWCGERNPDGLLIVEVAKSGEAKAAKDTIAALKAAGATVQEIAALKGQDRRKFVAAELRRVGVQADSDAERVLMDCEPDLRGIALRAEQLAMDLGAEGGRVRVTADQVASIASSTGTASGFLVADALAARDVQALAGAIRTATETGTAAVLIVSACLGALRDIAAVQGGSTAKMPPWKAQKAQRNARKWNRQSLATAVTLIGGAHPALGFSGRRDSDLGAALLRAASA